MGKPRPIDAAKFVLRMQAMRLYAVEHQTIRAISEQLGVPQRTLQDWLREVPRLPLRK